MRNAGLTGHVHFHGWLPAAEVDQAMRGADVLLLPSLSEGLSLVTVEALRAGLALIVSRIPGMDDVLVDGENGIACAALPAYAAALSAVIADRQRLLSMRRASAARAPLFDRERMIDAYERVLRQAATVRA